MASPQDSPRRSMLSRVLWFIDQFYGLLLPLAVTACIAGPIYLHTQVPELDSRLVTGLSIGLFVVAVLIVVLDAVALERRSKQPGFDPWTEI